MSVSVIVGLVVGMMLPIVILPICLFKLAEFGDRADPE